MTTGDNSPGLGGQQREGPTGREPYINNNECLKLMRNIIVFANRINIEITQDAALEMARNSFSWAQKKNLPAIADDFEISAEILHTRKIEVRFRHPAVLWNTHEWELYMYHRIGREPRFAKKTWHCRYGKPYLE